MLKDHVDTTEAMRKKAASDKLQTQKNTNEADKKKEQDKLKKAEADLATYNADLTTL